VGLNLSKLNIKKPNIDLSSISSISNTLKLPGSSSLKKISTASDLSSIAKNVKPNEIKNIMDVDSTTKDITSGIPSVSSILPDKSSLNFGNVSGMLDELESSTSNPLKKVQNFGGIDMDNLTDTDGMFDSMTGSMDNFINLPDADSLEPSESELDKMANSLNKFIKI